MFLELYFLELTSSSDAYETNSVRRPKDGRPNDSVRRLKYGDVLKIHRNDIRSPVDVMNQSRKRCNKTS